MQLIKGGSAYKFFKNHQKSRLRLPQGHFGVLEVVLLQ